MALTVSDFDFEEEDEVSSFPKIWDAQEVYTIVEVNFLDGRKLDENNISSVLYLINENLDWLEDNKSLIEKKLIDSNAPELARVWTAGLEVERIDDVDYAEIKGVKFPYPVTNKDFINSLSPNGLGIEIDEKSVGGQMKYDVFMTFYLSSTPDYFDGHTLEIEISADKSIELLGIIS